MMNKDKLYLGKSCQHQAILTLMENMSLDCCPNSELIESYQESAMPFLLQPFLSGDFNQNITVYSLQNKSLTTMIHFLHESIENHLQKIITYFEDQELSFSLSLHIKKLIVCIEENILLKEEQVFLHALYLCKILGQKTIDKEKFSLRLSCFSFKEYLKSQDSRIQKMWNIISLELTKHNNNLKLSKQINVFVEEWKYIQWIEENLFLQKALLLEKEMIKNIFYNKL